MSDETVPVAQPRPPDPTLTVRLYWPAHATLRTTPTPDDAEATFGQPGMTVRLVHQRDELRQLFTDAVAQLDAIDAG